MISLNSNLTTRFEDNRPLGFTPLGFRGPDPDSDCYENFRSCAGLLGCLNYGFLLGK
ncbi:hypothetical protein Hdeb2414_s0027g00694171 [Helianthus debilis subsp. tardiflorus]